MRVFYGLDDEYTSIAVVSLGKHGTGYNVLEELDEGRENIRSAIAGIVVVVIIVVVVVVVVVGR